MALYWYSHPFELCTLCLSMILLYITTRSHAHFQYEWNKIVTLTSSKWFHLILQLFIYFWTALRWSIINNMLNILHETSKFLKMIYFSSVIWNYWFVVSAFFSALFSTGRFILNFLFSFHACLFTFIQLMGSMILQWEYHNILKVVKIRLIVSEAKVIIIGRTFCCCCSYFGELNWRHF